MSKGTVFVVFNLAAGLVAYVFYTTLGDGPIAAHPWITAFGIFGMNLLGWHEGRLTERAR